MLFQHLYPVFSGLPDMDGKHHPSRSARHSRASSSGGAAHQADEDDDAYHFAKSLFDMKARLPSKAAELVLGP